MSRIDSQLGALGNGFGSIQTGTIKANYLTATTGTPSSSQFRSIVIGRAPCLDFTKDLGVRMGIDRIPIQKIMPVFGEQGPNGEPISKPINDKYDQVRFIGSQWTNQNNNEGTFILDGTGGGIAEFTFLGTGLDLLARLYASGTVLVSVDGGAYGASILPASVNTLFTARNYNPNQVVNAVAGLTFGVHTVSIKCTVANFAISGFHVLNESNNLRISAGQIVGPTGVLSLASAVSTPYNSGFESGTLGVRGGRGSVYLKKDGTIGKAVQPVASAASTTLASVDHVAANEEPIRPFFIREFSAGRSDDFGTLSSTNRASSAYTLEDGTSTLLASGNHFAPFANNSETINLNANGGFVTFTFTGSGLDMIENDQASGGSDTYNVQINNGSTLSLPTAGIASDHVVKIASGLPYGTHVVRINRVTAGTWTLGIKAFIVYGPKKPAIPAGAVELADYNIMATFSANGTAGMDTIATGVLRKQIALKEAVYTGSISGPSISLTRIGGYSTDTAATGGTVSYTFFGTGFDFRFGNSLQSVVNMAVDGAFVAAGNVSTYGTTETYSGVTGNFTSPGSLVDNGGIVVQNLSLGMHTVKITMTTGGNDFFVTAIDIITPIHVYKNNGPVVMQNTLAVGSQGINDDRKFSSSIDAPSKGLTCQLNGAYAFTASPSFSPIKWLNGAVYFDKTTRVMLTATMGTTGGSFPLRFMVDGSYITPLSSGYLQQRPTSGQDFITNVTATYVVPAGWHFLSVDANDGASSGAVDSQGGEFNVIAV